MRVKVTAEKIYGHCNVHKQGETFVFLKARGTKSRVLALDAERSCGKICVHALSMLVPYVFAEKTWGGGDPTDYYRCPDPGPEFCGKGSVIFKVERQVDESEQAE